MRCQSFKDKIELYIDNELSNWEKTEFERHLSKCPDCARELAVLKSIDSLGKLEIFSEPEPEYWNQLNQNIMQQISRPKEKTSWFADRLEQLKRIILPQKISYRLVGLAATAVIIFFIVHLSFFHHGKFELPIKIGVEDAIKFDKSQSDAMNFLEENIPDKKIPTGKIAPKITQSNQHRGAGLSKALEKESKIHIPEPAMNNENKTLSTATKLMEMPPAEELPAQRSTVPTSDLAIQAEKKARVDAFKMKKTTIQPTKNEATRFSIAAVSQRSMKAEQDSSLNQYHEIVRDVQTTSDLKAKIQTWEKYLTANPGDEFAKKAKYELAILYYQQVEANPNGENINQALTFYSEHSHFLFSAPDSIKFKQQFEVLQELLKKIEKKE
jgi:hypothetical protein